MKKLDIGFATKIANSFPSGLQYSIFMEFNKLKIGYSEFSNRFGLLFLSHYGNAIRNNVDSRAI
jgi:hypothetical protein